MQIKDVDKLIDEHKRLFREAAELQAMRPYTNKTTTMEGVSFGCYIEHSQKGTLARLRYHDIDKEILREFIDKSLAKKHKRMEEIQKIFEKIKNVKED